MLKQLHRQILSVNHHNVSETIIVYFKSLEVKKLCEFCKCEFFSEILLAIHFNKYSFSGGS